LSYFGLLTGVRNYFFSLPLGLGKKKKMFDFDCWSWGSFILEMYQYLELHPFCFILFFIAKKSILNSIHVSVHFLYSSLLLFFIGIREPPSSVYSLFLLIFFGVRESHSSICLAQRKRTKRKGTFSSGIF
jgi:hypothetical protein